MRQMMAVVALATGLLATAALAGSAAEQIKVFSAGKGKYIMVDRVRKTDEEWKKILTPEQFRITRAKGTERAFTGAFWNLHDPGVYQCVACGNDLFKSDEKFDSGTGWPSFTSPIAPENVKSAVDKSLFMERSEVLCARCESHLGHVFDDGPKPTGLRYCINSGALKFVKAKRPI